MEREYYFVSPHFDDAIGGCGGMIADLISHGENVTVVTVFGGIPQGMLSAYAEKLHKKWGIIDLYQRRFEDIRACKALGCNRKELDFLDAIYRKNNRNEYMYPSGDSLFSSPNDDAVNLRKEITKQIETLSNTNSVFYFPMGQGNHVDHIITHCTGQDLKRKGYKVSFYKEFFYANDCKMVPTCSDFYVSEELQQIKVKAMLQYQSQLPSLYKKTIEQEIIDCLMKETYDESKGMFVEKYTELIL